jgi:hypothetical protein
LRTLLYGELRKVAHSLPFYLAVLVVALVMMLCWVTETGELRLANQIYYMSFIFLIASPLVVCGVCSVEYDESTMKELLMAARSRSNVYLSKLVTTYVAVVAIFAIYIILLLASSYSEVEQLGWSLLSNQFLALIQHTFIVFNLAFLLRSSAALGASMIAFLLVYRQASLTDPTTLAGSLFHQTFLAQFLSVDDTGSIAIACAVVAVITCAVGFLTLSIQDV